MVRAMFRKLVSLLCLAYLAAAEQLPLRADDECNSAQCAVSALQVRVEARLSGLRADPEAPDSVDVPSGQSVESPRDEPPEEAEAEPQTAETQVSPVEGEVAEHPNKTNITADNSADSASEAEVADKPNQTNITANTSADGASEAEVADKPNQTNITANTSATSVKKEECGPPFADPYAQCGGDGWKGPTCCAEKRICFEVNKYYFHCMTKEEVIRDNTTTTTTTTTNADPQHCQLGYSQCGGMTNRAGRPLSAIPVAMAVSSAKRLTRTSSSALRQRKADPISYTSPPRS
ncbi:unnamed protein product [Effrenium voratum]|nr:unnamed protein product [Effrenium voratum]